MIVSTISCASPAGCEWRERGVSSKGHVLSDCVIFSFRCHFLASDATSILAALTDDQSTVIVGFYFLSRTRVFSSWAKSMFDIRCKLGVDPSWKVGLYEKGFRRDRPVGLLIRQLALMKRFLR